VFTPVARKSDTLESVFDGEKYLTSKFFRTKCWWQGQELLFVDDFVTLQAGNQMKITNFIVYGSQIIVQGTEILRSNALTSVDPDLLAVFPVSAFFLDSPLQILHSHPSFA